jgi:hypothetical protein
MGSKRKEEARKVKQEMAEQKKRDLIYVSRGTFVFVGIYEL